MTSGDRLAGRAARGGRRQGPVREGDRGGAARRARRPRRALRQGPAGAPRRRASRSRRSPRESDPRDALVGREPGARADAAAGRARRHGQRAARAASCSRCGPTSRCVPLRGNVDTRLRKLEERGLDAIVLACAGLDRLGLGGAHPRAHRPARLLPAVGQGTLALETRAGDALAARRCACSTTRRRAPASRPSAPSCAARGRLQRAARGLAEPLDGDRLRAARASSRARTGARSCAASGDAPLADAEARGPRASAEQRARGGGAAILERLRAEAAHVSGARQVADPRRRRPRGART